MLTCDSGPVQAASLQGTLLCGARQPRSSGGALVSLPEHLQPEFLHPGWMGGLGLGPNPGRNGAQQPSPRGSPSQAGWPLASLCLPPASLVSVPGPLGATLRKPGACRGFSSVESQPGLFVKRSRLTLSLGCLLPKCPAPHVIRAVCCSQILPGRLLSELTRRLLNIRIPCLLPAIPGWVRVRACTVCYNEVFTACLPVALLSLHSFLVWLPQTCESLVAALGTEWISRCLKIAKALRQAEHKLR